MNRGPLYDYFNELLHEAIFNENIHLNQLSIDYVVNIMHDFMHYENLFCIQKDERGTPSLAWLYEKAVSSTGSLKKEAYRKLGDVALIVSGMYADHVNPSPGASYYIDMGSSAYHVVYQMNSSFIMAELAKKFSDVMEAIIRVSEQTTIPNKFNKVARLYDMHVKNPSDMKTIDRLAAYGVIPIIKL